MWYDVCPQQLFASFGDIMMMMMMLQLTIQYLASVLIHAQYLSTVGQHPFRPVVAYYSLRSTINGDTG